MRGRINIAEFVLLFIMYCIFSACNSQKKELQDKVKKVQSAAISIPYERMVCWTSDSVRSVSPWNKAKLKLVHYIDSASCSTCYLQKAATDELLNHMESLGSNDFCNVFIVTPGDKARKRLETDFREKRLPRTIFVDTANVFIGENPNIPSESMYHTFLLDENNNVVLVGNPMLNKQIEEMMLSIVEERLGKKLNVKK